MTYIFHTIIVRREESHTVDNLILLGDKQITLAVPILRRRIPEIDQEAIKGKSQRKLGGGCMNSAVEVCARTVRLEIKNALPMGRA